MQNGKTMLVVLILGYTDYKMIIITHYIVDIKT